MSLDSVDDIEAAEDLMHSAAAKLRELIMALDDWIPTLRTVRPVKSRPAQARRAGLEVLATIDEYCRPTCGGERCTGDLCGCPHHDREAPLAVLQAARDAFETRRPARENPWHEWPHRYLADGRLLALEPLLMGAARLHVVAEDTDAHSDEVYDFQELMAGLVALHRWDGTDEPEGWYRHRPSNRRRPGGDPEKEYVAP